MIREYEAVMSNVSVMTSTRFFQSEITAENTGTADANLTQKRNACEEHLDCYYAAIADCTVNAFSLKSVIFFV